jgi:ferric-dicitrate binding protein FerR (iron transport regulator)
MPEHEEEHIQYLIRKFLSGNINDEEKAILEQWYTKLPPETPQWELKENNKEELEQRLYNQVRSQIDPKKTVLSLWTKLAVAAAILLIPAISLLLYFSPVKEATVTDNQIVSTVGLIRKVYLPDHSIVWLKGNSSLHYPSKFSDSTRNVSLQGEALFEVSKDRRHPFIIKTGNFVTRVLGTSFNICENTKANTFNLVVLTGKVMVAPVKNDDGKTRPVLVTPDKEFESAGAAVLPVISPSKLSNKNAVVSGTEYLMEFENAGFDEVKKKIEQKFNVQIQADNNTYQNCRLSANVTDQSLENTLRVICAAMGAEYTITSNIIKITGGGCNQ